MNSKLFELRDRGTFVPVMATKVEPASSQEAYLLGRAGYNLRENYVIMCGLDGGLDKATCDPYDWSNRTRQVAHEYIRENFDELENGQVIDVEFILGESGAPKESESKQ